MALLLLLLLLLLLDAHRMLEFQSAELQLFRPDLWALGAVDGRPASGLPEDNDDPLSRRDSGLEFLDVTARADISLIDSSTRAGRREGVYQITNTSSSIVDTHSS